jgi:hypothetical protein
MRNWKNIILLGAGIFLLCLFFLLPRNQTWLAQRVLPYWKDFQRQKNILDLEKRKVERYESAYTYSKQIAGYFERKGIRQDVLVLIPSSAYFKSRGVNYPVPEPAVFYYYTGLKTVWPNSSAALKANWYVHASEGRILIDSIAGTPGFMDTLSGFQKFPVSL